MITHSKHIGLLLDFFFWVIICTICNSATACKSHTLIHSYILPNEVWIRWVFIEWDCQLWRERDAVECLICIGQGLLRSSFYFYFWKLVIVSSVGFLQDGATKRAESIYWKCLSAILFKSTWNKSLHNLK